MTSSFLVKSSTKKHQNNFSEIPGKFDQEITLHDFRKEVERISKRPEYQVDASYVTTPDATSLYKAFVPGDELGTQDLYLFYPKSENGVRFFAIGKLILGKNGSPGDVFSYQWDNKKKMAEALQETNPFRALESLKGSLPRKKFPKLSTAAENTLIHLDDYGDRPHSPISKAVLEELHQNILISFRKAEGGKYIFKLTPDGQELLAFLNKASK